MKITEIERREILRYMEMYDFREYLRGKTFLITGSSGIIGTGLIKWILLENELHSCNAHIIASTRNPKTDSEYITYCPFGREKEAAAQYQIDYIVHAASPTDSSFRKEHPRETFQVNVDMMQDLLTVAKAKGSPVLFLSSEEIYGTPQTELPLSEEMTGAIDSLTLRNSYPLAKKVCEFLCCAASAEYGTKTEIVRLSTTIGLFQKTNWGNVANEILNCIVDGRDLHMKSDGLTKKCILYSLDAISALLLILFKGESGHAYNASNPSTFMTVKDMANHLFARFAPNLKIIFEQGADFAAMGFLPHRTLQQDIRKIKKLGWEPRTSLEEIYRIDIERLKP